MKKTSLDDARDFQEIHMSYFVVASTHYYHHSGLLAWIMLAPIIFLLVYSNQTTSLLSLLVDRIGLTCVCYHESGHAIVSMLVLGKESVKSIAANPIRGHVLIDYRYASNKDALMIHCAGNLACCYYGTFFSKQVGKNNPAETDSLKAYLCAKWLVWHLKQQVNVPDNGRSAIFSEQMAECGFVLENNERLAVNRVEHRVLAILKANQVALGLLARHLMTHSEVTGEEAFALVGPHLVRPSQKSKRPR